MSLIIIGDAFTFPEGNAATNKVHLCTRGFMKADGFFAKGKSQNNLTELIFPILIE